MYLFKRLTSLSLIVCLVMLLCAPAMVWAEETEASNTAINYDLYYSGLSYTTNGIASLLGQSATLSPLYESGELNFLPYAKSSTRTPYFYSSEADTSSPYGYDGLLLQNGLVGDWVAYKIKNPGVGTYEMTLNHFYNNAHCALEYSVYILPSDTAEADISAALTEDTLLGTANITSDGKTSATNYSQSVTGSFTTDADTADYLVVIQASADNATASTRVDMMLSGLTLTEVAPPAVNYDLYYSGLSYTTNGIASLLGQSATLSPLYESGELNFLPYAKSSTRTPYFYSSVADTSSPYGYDGLLLQNGLVGDWVAYKIKNPGVGTYEMTLNHFYNNAHCALEYSVYILPSDTAEADISAALTEDTLLGTANITSDGKTSATNYSQSVTGSFTTDADTADYLVVIQASADNATASTRVDMMFSGLTLTEVAPPAVNYDLYYSGLSYTTNGIASLLGQSATLSPLYESGELNFLPYAKSSTRTPYFYSSAADTSSPYGYDGLLLQNGLVGDWVAYKIKNPGAGTYNVTLNHFYNNAHCALEYSVYILPSDTAEADISAALTEDTLLGTASITSDGKTSATNYSQSVTGSFTTDADTADYLVVIQASADNATASTRVDMMLSGLTLSRGGSTEPAFTPVSGQLVAGDLIGVSEYYRAAAGVNPANSHDLLYLLFKGSTMLVYDLDTGEKIDEEDSTHSTPFGNCFDDNGNLWVCGSGNYLYKYDPTTGIGTKYTFDYALFDGIKANAYGITCADGVFYFGYYGQIGKFDPATGTFTNLSGMLNTSDTLESDAQFVGYGGIVVQDGYLYTSIDGDLNGDLTETHQLIKYDIANQQIVDYLDISDVSASSNYGVNYLNCVNGKLIGSFATKQTPIYVDISGDEMVRLDSMNGVYCFVGDISGELDGKVYAAGYASSTAGTKYLYAYDVATGTAESTGIVATSTLACLNGIVTVPSNESLPGQSIVTLKNNSATGTVDVVFYNAQTDATVTWENFTLGEGTGMLLRAITTDPSGENLYVGAYGTNQIAQYNVATGQIQLNTGYGHQTDSLCWYGDYLYVGNYSSGAITQFDVTTGSATHFFDLMDTVFQQKRMFALTAGDGKIFCGTVPETSRVGGALVWYDLTADRTYVAAGPNPEDVYWADTTDVASPIWYNAVSGEVEDFDADGDGDFDYNITNEDGETVQRFYGVIENQCINSIVYQDGYIIGTTTKANGQTVGLDAFEGNALIFVYDVAAMKVVATCDVGQTVTGLADPASGWIDWIDAFAADPYEDGKYWGVVSDTLFSVDISIDSDTSTAAFSVTEELSLEKNTDYKHSGSVWSARAIVFDGEYLYASFGNYGTYLVNTQDTTEYYRLSATVTAEMVLAADGNVYFFTNTQNGDHTAYDLMCFQTGAFTQPLAAASVQDVINALPAEIALTDEAAIVTARAMYDDLTATAKALVDTTALTVAESALSALKTTE